MVMLLVRERALENRAGEEERHQFGRRLRQARQSAGLTLQAVGDVIGVVREAVSKWEAGHHYPTPDRLQNLGDLFDISVDWLLRGDRQIAEMRAIYDATGREKVVEEIKETLDVAGGELPMEELRRIRNLVRFMVQEARRGGQKKGGR